MVRPAPAAKEENGFTLVELLIVVIVLGLLAAIVVFAIGDTRSNALESTCRTTVNSVELAAEAYHTKNDAYPAAHEDANLADQALGGLLKSWPVETSPDYRLDWN